LRQFFAAAESNHIYDAFVLLAMTGMRRGEVLGVRWKDIDLDSGELAIVQTITNVDGKLTVGSPKTTKSRRVIYLDETTVTMLRQHRRQREGQIAIGPDWGNDGDLACTRRSCRNASVTRRSPSRSTCTHTSRPAWPEVQPISLQQRSSVTNQRTRRAGL
jgi:integrase